MDVGDLIGGRYRVLGRRSAGTCGRAFEAHDERANVGPSRSRQGAVLLQELDILATPPALSALKLLAERAKQNPVVLGTAEVLVEGTGFVLVYELPHTSPAGRAQTLTELARLSVPPLKSDLARKVLSALFEALARFHDAGDVHGALSPRNIFWCGDRCVFLGGGLATEATGLEVAGHRDVFAYGAPELFRREPASAAADVFAAAAIAHVLLTGHLPHEGKNVLETLDNRAKVAAAPISRWLGGEVEPVLDAFFASALAPRADQRPRDGRALAAAWSASVMPSASQAREPQLAKLVATSSVAQREVLRAATEWLEQGGTLLPTDLVMTLATELTDRIDREVCEAAWEDEDGPASRARIFVGEAEGGIIDSVDALPCAREDLRALVAEARRDVLAMLARVSVDHAPRGVEAVGDSRAHVRLRVGPHRLLFCVRGGLVVLTRIMQGFDPVAKDSGATVATPPA